MIISLTSNVEKGFNKVDNKTWVKGFIKYTYFFVTKSKLETHSTFNQTDTEAPYKPQKTQSQASCWRGVRGWMRNDQSERGLVSDNKNWAKHPLI